MTGINTEKAAANWVVKFDKADIQPEGNVVDNFSITDSEFAGWVSESIENRVEFLRLHAAWQRADRLVALSLEDTFESPPEQHRKKQLYQRKAIWGSVGTAIAACLLIFAVPFGSETISPIKPQFLETETGGRVTVPLADGTVLDLNTDTKLTTDITATFRKVALERGEVFFDVAHDPDRPFIIDVEDKRIIVLGTKFSVRSDESGFEVIVLDGKVKVENLKQSSATQTVVLEKGAIAHASNEGTLITNKAAPQIISELSWRDGMLSFDDVTLKEAVAEFNRYNAVPMEITDPAVAAIRIGGSFQAKNIDGFTRILTTGFGLKIEQTDDKIAIKS